MIDHNDDVLAGLRRVQRENRDLKKRVADLTEETHRLTQEIHGIHDSIYAVTGKNSITQAMSFVREMQKELHALRGAK